MLCDDETMFWAVIDGAARLADLVPISLLEMRTRAILILVILLAIELADMVTR
jgi:hypothetical protein